VHAPLVPPVLPDLHVGLADLPGNMLFFGAGRQAFKFLAAHLLAADANRVFVVPAYTCETVVQALREAGGHVLFCDVDDRLDLDEEDLRRLLQSCPAKRPVLVPTALFGAPVRDHKRQWPEATVIEDRCQSMADPGSTADYQILSFGIGKLVSGFAGGALLGHIDPLRGAHGRLDTQGGFWASLFAAILVREVALRRGWRWVRSLAGPEVKSVEEVLAAKTIEVRSLQALRARWVTYSLSRVRASVRTERADWMADHLPAGVRFQLPKGVPYLRYPVRRGFQAPGVSSGRMFEPVWRMAEQERGRAMPGAAALVQASLLPTHSEVTAQHLELYQSRLT
jgi:hypothetical protein